MAVETTATERIGRTGEEWNAKAALGLAGADSKALAGTGTHWQEWLAMHRYGANSIGIILKSGEKNDILCLAGGYPETKSRG